MLTKLFTSKTRIKLLIHFLFSNQNYKLRELARKTNLPVSAVSRELNNLMALSLIKKEKDHFVPNKKSNLLPGLRTLFLKTDAFQLELEKALKDKSVKFAFVFGSFANDSYTADSDIDLFIVGDIRLEEILKIIQPLEIRLEREINPVVWSMADLKAKKGLSFIRDIAKKKIIILKGNENELRKIIG